MNELSFKQIIFYKINTGLNFLELSQLIIFLIFLMLINPHCLSLISIKYEI